MFQVSESQKKVLKAWIIVGIVILILVSCFALLTVKENKKEVKEEGITAKNSKMVIDKSRYYTVKNAITKYYSYVNMHDYDSVLKILDKKYVESNNIDSNNIKEKLNYADVSISYDSRIMCLSSSNKGVYSFVVDGNEISANTGSVLNKVYYEIIMDGNNQTFSLKPIEENTYKEVCNG